jgi:hypothetical protein
VLETLRVNQKLFRIIDRIDRLLPRVTLQYARLMSFIHQGRPGSPDGRTGRAKMALTDHRNRLGNALNDLIQPKKPIRRKS